MTPKEITALLSEVVSMYAPSSVRKVNITLTKKLKLYTAETSISAEKDGYNAAVLALSDCGIILEQNSDTSSNGIVMSGSMNMNPAYIEVSFYDNTVNIKAYALEGLIKQNTTNKAIEKLKSHIK